MEFLCYPLPANLRRNAKVYEFSEIIRNPGVYELIVDPNRTEVILFVILQKGEGLYVSRNNVEKLNVSAWLDANATFYKYPKKLNIQFSN